MVACGGLWWPVVSYRDLCFSGLQVTANLRTASVWDTAEGLRLAVGAAHSPPLPPVTPCTLCAARAMQASIEIGQYIVELAMWPITRFKWFRSGTARPVCESVLPPPE
jgi:hypothetical protein